MSPFLVRAILVLLLHLSSVCSMRMLRFYNFGRGLTNNLLEASFLTSDDMSTEAIIKRRGYPAETHRVHTEDGYILELHRIPHGRNSTANTTDPTKYPVIVQHGNFQSSADWLLEADGLGFFLADNGYDVWLGNQRGNDYSHRHVSFPAHSSSFWNFSFHEMGMFDLPAVLDYVTKTSGKRKVHYISFSLGTTAFFAGISKKPELSEKLALGVVMGPSTFQTNFWHGWVQLFAPFVWLMQIFQKYSGDAPVLSSFATNFLHKFLPVICHPKVDLFGVCINFVQIAFGQDRGRITKERLHTVTKVSPSPSSLKAFLHEMQLMGTGRFCEYDYGSDLNLKVYGSDTPPDYNLTNCAVPIALIVGENDFLAHKEDAKLLASKLPNVVDFHYPPFDYFTHLDFCYGTDVGTLVYDHVVNLLHKYDNT